VREASGALAQGDPNTNTTPLVARGSLVLKLRSELFQIMHLTSDRPSNHGHGGLYIFRPGCMQLWTALWSHAWEWACPAGYEYECGGLGLKLGGQGSSMYNHTLGPHESSLPTIGRDNLGGPDWPLALVADARALTTRMGRGYDLFKLAFNCI
jgi:hypothetical protein